MSTLSSRAEADGSRYISGRCHRGIESLASPTASTASQLLVRRVYPERASRVEWALLRMTLEL